MSSFLTSPSLDEVEKMVRKEAIEELYDVGPELGRCVSGVSAPPLASRASVLHALLRFMKVSFTPLQGEVRHCEEMHRESERTALCRQVSPQASWREVLSARHYDGGGHCEAVHASSPRRETARGVRVDERDDHHPRTVRRANRER